MKRSRKSWAKNVSGHCKQAALAPPDVRNERHALLGKPNSATGTDMTICTSSLIRTVTVGSGIAPDLLTPRRLLHGSEAIDDMGARGLTSKRDCAAGIPPVGNLTPP
jgi:hypothetical protein